uniref:DUF4457 domain-containing protein n=1 Tax=Panagrellus redivivus TaxID=6233 RepID=A0A7E4VNG0_PANRE
MNSSSIGASIEEREEGPLNAVGTGALRCGTKRSWQSAVIATWCSPSRRPRGSTLTTSIGAFSAKSVDCCVLTMSATAIISPEAPNHSLIGGQSGMSIPELPSGKKLRFILLYPWDDPMFIGISALEIFAATGERLQSSRISTNAVKQIGTLETLLSCNTCPTTDPRRMWACNYRENGAELPIWIDIELKAVATIAMIRVWNYNQSRVHALRGVHEMRIELDGRLIFEGEISCAYSDGNDAKDLGDTILFTTSTDILDLVAENDIFLNEYDSIKATLTGLDDLSIASDGTTPLMSPASSIADACIQRPRTAATGSRESRRGSLADSDKTEHVVSTDEDDLENVYNVYKTKLFHVELKANWGHHGLIGLTGIQFLGPDGEPVHSDEVTVKLSHGELCEGESLASLLNKKNLSCTPSDMCLLKFDPQTPIPMLSFTFPKEVSLSGVSIWNYNASAELACAGVRCAQFYVNGKPIVSPVLLRKAPGYVYFDYVQDISFDRCHLFRPVTSRPNTRSISAFIFQLRLLSTWGDEYYIGLNGLEFYNRRNHRINLGHQNIAAFPESVNILPTVDHDPRSSDKLIDGQNDTKKAHHMWLTPMLPNRYARVFVIFDSPTFVSRIRVFNYRKTPERGVRHVTLSADDLIVYSGEIPMSTAAETGILDINLREA